MEKKNLFWSMLAVMMMAVFCGMTTACSSDDDDDNNGGGSTTNSVIGTWSGTDDGETMTLTFNSGNTGTYTYSYEDSYYGSGTETGKFTYTTKSDSRGTIFMSGYLDEMDYEIKGSKMSLYDEDGDLEWVLTKR